MLILEIAGGIILAVIVLALLPLIALALREQAAALLLIAACIVAFILLGSWVSADPSAAIGLLVVAGFIAFVWINLGKHNQDSPETLEQLAAYASRSRAARVATWIGRIMLIAAAVDLAFLIGWSSFHT